MRLTTLWSAFSISMLMCLPHIAVASDWQLVNTDQTVKIYVDTESLGHRGPYVKAWFMWDYAIVQKGELIPSNQFLSQKGLWYISCSEKTSAQIQSISYRGNAGAGDVVTSYAIPIEVAQFQDVVPDSVGQMLVNYVCKREGAKSRQ